MNTKKGPKALLSKVDLPSEYMVVDPDVELCFDDGAVPGHSQLLGFCSNDLREAVQAGSGGASNGGEKSQLSIPMPGTSSTDWLKLIPFIYPGDQPEVTWDNVEALLVLGNKYDIPRLASRATQFVSAHQHELDTLPESCSYIWKWIFLLDNAAIPGREGLFEDCIQIVATNSQFKRTCKRENMKGLSTKALEMLASALAGMFPFKGWCPTCIIPGEPSRKRIGYLVCNRCRHYIV